MMQKHIQNILEEMQRVLSSIREEEVERLASAICEARVVVVAGAGRVGMAGRGFAMRLAHLGLAAHMLGDATVPSIGESDLFLVASGSGETQTIYELVVIAKKNKARVALITGNPDSRMGKLADMVVTLPAPSKTNPRSGVVSVQPMTTLNEQCLAILFDAIVLHLMTQMNETHETMWGRHSNLE